MIVMVVLSVKNIQHAKGFLSTKGTFCSVHRKSKMPKFTQCKYGPSVVFNEKFIFAHRLENPAYGRYYISVYAGSAVPNAEAAFPPPRDELEINLDRVFRKHNTPSPIEQWDDLPNSQMRVHYVLHRIRMVSHQQQHALKALGMQCPNSVNDREDLRQFGKILPELWYDLPMDTVDSSTRGRAESGVRKAAATTRTQVSKLTDRMIKLGRSAS